MSGGESVEEKKKRFAAQQTAEQRELRRAALSGDNGAWLKLGEPSVASFHHVVQRVACPYARSSVLLGAPVWDPQLSPDTNILHCAHNLRRVAELNKSIDALDGVPDGMVMEVPIRQVKVDERPPGEMVGVRAKVVANTSSDSSLQPFVGQEGVIVTDEGTRIRKMYMIRFEDGNEGGWFFKADVELGPLSSNWFSVVDLARLVGQVFTILAGEDEGGCSSVRELLRKQSDEGWRFSFAGCGMFVSTFAPCYPRSSTRHQFGMCEESCFILFQPDAAFARRGVTPSQEQAIRAKFASKQQRYRGELGNAVVKPLDEYHDPPVEWWKIGSDGEECLETLPPVPKTVLPQLYGPWQAAEWLKGLLAGSCSEAGAIKKLRETWQSSKSLLGDIVSFRYNAALLSGCDAVRRFELNPMQGGKGRDRKENFVFHGTSAEAAECILREGFDPQRRKIQTYGPGEYLALRASDAAGYCRGSGTMVFAMCPSVEYGSLTKAVYGTNLQSATRYGIFDGPVHQLKVDNPRDCSFSCILPLGIVYFKDPSACSPPAPPPPMPTPAAADSPPQKLADQQQMHTRLSDVAYEPLVSLGAITGIERTARLPLLEAAIATRVDDVDAHAFLAAESGAALAEKDPHGLDADETGALMLYTMESELYTTLNRLLRQRDRELLKPFFPYLLLLLTARRKLPKYVGTVWRGVKSIDLRTFYPKGKEFYWWAFSSTTKELSILQNPMFLGTSGVRTVFNIQVSAGVDLVRYSMFQGSASEAEVLLYPGTKLKVVDAMDMGSGLHMIHLEQVHVPVELMK